MTQLPTYDPHNPHSVSTLQKELVWEGKYDEYGNRRKGDIAGCAVTIGKVYDRLNITPDQLIDFCQKWQIAELAVFGSVLRQDFRANGGNPSDVDLLYSFSESSSCSLFDVMKMQEELESLCHRRVDLISKAGIQKSRNWLRRREILTSSMILYVQG